MRFGRDPHAFLEDCVRDHGDPFTLRLPGDPLRLVTGDPALIKQVFALSPDDYEQRTASFPLNIRERSLLFLDGEEHRRDRHVMMPPLHGERLRGYVASMREVTARAVSRFTVGSVQPLRCSSRRSPSTSSCTASSGSAEARPRSGCAARCWAG
jgi:cytochrome P450 family 110